MNRVLYDVSRMIVFSLICLLPSIAAADNATAGQQYGDKFRLKVYEATIKVDPFSQDKYCLDHMRYYRSLICIDEVCNSVDKSKKSVDCAPTFAALYSPELQDKMSATFCSVMNYPSSVTRHVYRQHSRDLDNRRLVGRRNLIISPVRLFARPVSYT